MESKPVNFTLAEKSAVVYVVHSVILADEYVHDGEIDALTRLMTLIDFDSNDFIQAQTIGLEQSISILKSMPDKKKSMLESTLETIAISDGFLHKKETKFMDQVFQRIGINKTGGNT